MVNDSVRCGNTVELTLALTKIPGNSDSRPMWLNTGYRIRDYFGWARGRLHCVKSEGSLFEGKLCFHSEMRRALVQLKSQVYGALYQFDGGLRVESRLQPQFELCHAQRAMFRLFAAMLFCLPLPALAQNSISGTVKNGSSAPIDSAKVVVFDASGKGVQTSSSAGSFALTGVSDGEYYLRIESVGNKPIFGALRLNSNGPKTIDIVATNALPDQPESVGAGAALRASVRPPRSSPKPPKVKPAQLTTKVTPSYPEAERKAGVRGIVRLAMIILPNGTVDDLVVLSAPTSNFALAALDAVRRWRYNPTYLDGQPVEASLTVDVNFDH
jgi:TonB family protein